MSMFEMPDNFIEPKSLHELYKTDVAHLYLDDLGEVSSDSILNHYLKSSEPLSVQETSLYHKAPLDTHIPPSSPFDFSTLRTTVNGCLQDRLDGCSNTHIVLSKNSSLVHSSLLDGNSSSAIFSSLLNSSFNPILYIASLFDIIKKGENIMERSIRPAVFTNPEQNRLVSGTVDPFQSSTTSENITRLDSDGRQSSSSSANLLRSASGLSSSTDTIGSRRHSEHTSQTSVSSLPSRHQLNPAERAEQILEQTPVSQNNPAPIKIDISDSNANNT